LSLLLAGRSFISTLRPIGISSAKPLYFSGGVIKSFPGLVSCHSNTSFFGHF
jgi:hypothetical protein